MIAFIITILGQTNPEILPDTFQSINDGYAAYGWLGGLAALITAGVTIFRFIMPKLWDRLSKWVQLLVVFGFAGVGAALLSIAGGVALPAALMAGFMGGLSAIGIHQNIKTGKEMLTKSPKQQ
jgi:hypothetical protein